MVCVGIGDQGSVEGDGERGEEEEEEGGGERGRRRR